MTSDLLTNSPWADHAGADLAAVRAEAERTQHAVERIKATRVVASAAASTTEAAEFLSMLGLSVEDLQAARTLRIAAA